MPGKLKVLMGLARAGKSTYCTQFVTHPNTVVVNSDQVRLAAHGQRFNKLAEPFIHCVTKVMVRSLYNQGYIVIIDETNSTIGSIKQWLEIDTDAEFIYIDTPVEECERRAIATNQNDLVDKGVIRRMYRNLIDLCNYADDKVFYCSDLRKDKVTKEYLMHSIEEIRKEVKGNLQ